MPTPLLFAVLGLAVLAIIVLSILAHVRSTRERTATLAALERLGLRPCPEEKNHLTELVTQLERNPSHQYAVESPMCLVTAGKTIFYYRMTRLGHEEAVVQEEILLPLARPPKAGMVLVVKPSSLAPGLATRLIERVATPCFVSNLLLPSPFSCRTTSRPIASRSVSLADVKERACFCTSPSSPS